MKPYIFAIFAVLMVFVSCSKDDEPLIVTFDQLQGRWEVDEGSYSGTTLYLYPDSSYFLSTQYTSEKEHGHITHIGNARINNDLIEMNIGESKPLRAQITEIFDDYANIKAYGCIKKTYLTFHRTASKIQK